MFWFIVVIKLSLNTDLAKRCYDPHPFSNAYIYKHPSNCYLLTFFFITRATALFDHAASIIASLHQQPLSSLSRPSLSSGTDAETVKRKNALLAKRVERVKVRAVS